MIRYDRLSAPKCLLAKQGKLLWQSSGTCYQAIQIALGNANQEHCAFCDGKLGIESKSTVEHFRPKSKFPNLIYAWQNLFPACDVCQSVKGTKFDDLLLKPDDDGYTFGKYFQINWLSGAIEPLESATLAAQFRAKVTIGMYQLNEPKRLSIRKHELKHWQLTDLNNRVLDEFSYRYFINDGIA